MPRSFCLFSDPRAVKWTISTTQALSKCTQSLWKELSRGPRARLAFEKSKSRKLVWGGGVEQMRAMGCASWWRCQVLRSVQEEELAVPHDKRKAREGRTCHSDSLAMEHLPPVEMHLLWGCWAWERMTSLVLDKLQVTYLRDTQRHFRILVGDGNPE